MCVGRVEHTHAGYAADAPYGNEPRCQLVKVKTRLGAALNEYDR